MSNGFNFQFIKSNWEITKRDVIDAIESFQYAGFIPRSSNASFMTLVSKKDHPQVNLDQYLR